MLIQKTISDLGYEALPVEIPDLEEKITEVQEEILAIQSTEPYTYKYLLEDDKAMAEKKTELEKELEDYVNYHKELQNVLDEIDAEYLNLKPSRVRDYKP